MAKRILIAVAVVVGAIILFGVMWAFTYPKNDPKNIEYVFWKHHLLEMDLDAAVNTMGWDVDRFDMVVGKSEHELADRFGYLTPMSQAPAYLQRCYRESVWNGHRAMFLRRSIFLVIFENGRASHLITMKDC